MASDFFLGFAGHAHTMNELETDQQRELELRSRNSPEEAQKLVGMVLDKLEKDLSDSGYSLEDVKLLILYLSYRGEPAEKDKLICGTILGAIESRFKRHAANQLRLIGHTTGGELENEDLVLKEISGIGYNGLSLLALVTNLPIGVGRTWGLRTAEEAGEQGREMARDAWVDFNQQTTSKEHLHMRKTLLVLTQGSKVDNPGYEHFLGEGIANFMGSTREARIMNVIGGSGGDGVIAKLCNQFYGRLEKHSQLKVLDGEAVCALIPNLCETSIGLDVNAITKIGRQHTFHFDSEKEPHFKYVKRIGNEDPCTKYAEVIYENEVQLSKEKGLPLVDKEIILGAIRLSRAQKRLMIFNPVVARYAFAFPFGNYTCVATMRVVGEDIELMFPIRSYTPEMPGYFVIGDHRKVQKGGRRVYDMLREDQGFSRNDATFLVSCINRRIVELMAGCKSGTEAEILKEGLSSTQVIGFLAYGELSFTNLIQEPYIHGFTCWGITLHSKQPTTKPKEKKKGIGIKAVGLEEFEHTIIEAQLSAFDEATVEEEVEVRLDLVNVAKESGLLVRVDDLIPPSFKVTSPPPQYSIEDGSIDMKGKKIDPLKVETIKLSLRATEPGVFNLSPQVIYIDELGKFRTSKVEPVPVTVHPKIAFEFKTKAAKNAFDYLIRSFVEDYMRQRMSLEKSGWRTSMEIVKHGKVSKSSVYGTKGRRGRALSELERRGLVETRVFLGERGRGGKILKMRISYDKETIKRHIDQRIMKIKEK